MINKESAAIQFRCVLSNGEILAREHTVEHVNGASVEGGVVFEKGGRESCLCRAEIRSTSIECCVVANDVDLCSFKPPLLGTDGAAFHRNVLRKCRVLKENVTGVGIDGASTHRRFVLLQRHARSSGDTSVKTQSAAAGAFVRLEDRIGQIHIHALRLNPAAAVPKSAILQHQDILNGDLSVDATQRAAASISADVSFQDGVFQRCRSAHQEQSPARAGCFVVLKSEMFTDEGAVECRKHGPFVAAVSSEGRIDQMDLSPRRHHKAATRRRRIVQGADLIAVQNGVHKHDDAARSAGTVSMKFR